MDDLETYSTTDSALSAWLYLQGSDIESVTKNRQLLTEFHFKGSPELRQSIRQWQTGAATGNCCLYEQARRTVLKMVKVNQTVKQNSLPMSGY